ncbi:hypothetical protein [Rufibacter immobilis]
MSASASINKKMNGPILKIGNTAVKAQDGEFVLEGVNTRRA